MPCDVAWNVILFPHWKVDWSCRRCSIFLLSNFFLLKLVASVWIFSSYANGEVFYPVLNHPLLLANDLWCFYFVTTLTSVILALFQLSELRHFGRVVRGE
jgi:hypothetical protein